MSTFSMLAAASRRCTPFRVLVTLVLVGWSVVAWAEEEVFIHPRAPDRVVVHPFGEPVDRSSLTQTKLLVRKGYQVLYDDEHRVPRWSAYFLFQVGEPGKPDDRAPERPNDAFAVDPETQAQVDPEDYKRYGLSAKYDRGHMAPSYGIGSRYGEKAQVESFLMSNMAPQWASLNRGMWRGLEKKEADLYANGLKQIWIIDGPIYELEEKSAGTQPISIPRGFFKIMLVVADDNRPVTQAFIFENAKPDRPLERCLVSVREIEAQTKLNFFPRMPAALQDRVEARKPNKLWTVAGKN